MKKYGIMLIVLLAVVIGGALYWLNKDNTVEVATEEKTTLSPTLVESIEAIGQWEFLAISDEELVDTVRRGFFGDDQLVRIYYGTLRLGIDMKDVKEGWMKVDEEKDSLTCPQSACSTTTSLTKPAPRVSLKRENGPEPTARRCTTVPTP